MRRMSPLLAAVLMATVLLACGGSDDGGDEAEGPPDPFPLQPAEGPEDGLRVTVVGDSITALAGEPLRSDLSEARASLTAVPGYRLGQFDLGPIDDQDPDVVVIALGTNNVLQGGWDGDDEAELDQLLDDVGDRRCTLLVDVVGVGDVIVADEVVEDFDRGARAANRALADAARTRDEGGNPTRIVAWSEVAPRPGVMSGDGIHPTRDGAEAWARLVSDEIDAGC